MSRFFAQLAAVIFVIVTAGGFVVGNNGNFDGVQVHMTLSRDILDLVFLAVFIWVGFGAGLHLGRIVTGAAGVVLLLLGIFGFIYGDTDAGTRSLLGLHFPLAINIFDLVMGVLAVLAALGTIEAPDPRYVRTGSKGNAA